MSKYPRRNVIFSFCLCKLNLSNFLDVKTVEARFMAYHINIIFFSIHYDLFCVLFFVCASSNSHRFFPQSFQPAATYKECWYGSFRIFRNIYGPFVTADTTLFTFAKNPNSTSSSAGVCVPRRPHVRARDTT